MKSSDGKVQTWQEQSRDHRDRRDIPYRFENNHADHENEMDGQMTVRNARYPERLERPPKSATFLTALMQGAINHIIFLFS